MPATRTITYDTINDAQTIAGSGEGTLLANRYRVVRQLGQGGMGSVWLAEDTQLDNKPFAIKMLPSILVSNKRAYRQLKDEALVAMKLTHPNIVTLRAFEENNGNPFLVMDYIDGQTLDDYLVEHTGTTGVSPVGGGTTGTTGVSPVAAGLPEADVLRILRPIAAALDYAHTKGIVHRDVKPGNVMIAKDGTPYVLDFGIAREIQETMTRVTGKLSSGTLYYMSPEQLNGEAPKPAQDVYSFAAMVYESLKGEPPFSHGQIEFQIMNKVPGPLIGYVDLSAPLAASVMAGLAKKPQDRPPTCTAVLEGRIPDVPQSDRTRAPNALPDPKTSKVASRLPQSGGWKSLLAMVALGLVVTGVCWLSHDISGMAKEKMGEGHTLVASEHRGFQLWEDGPYWAETNIGAEKPWESGYYFWWGDTVGCKRENDAWVASDGSKSNCSFGREEPSTCDKEISVLKREGWITANNVLAPQYDAAQVQWGGGWRMPTRQELDDLRNKCDWTWTKMNGVNGCVVCGRGAYASDRIFFPCAGGGDGTSLDNAGSLGIYWSSVPEDSRFGKISWSIYFTSNIIQTTDGGILYGRRNGFSIRPVQGFTK